MKMYLKLVSVFLKENFSSRNAFQTYGKKTKTKKILMGLLILYVLASVLFSFGFLFFELGKVFNEMNSIEVILMYMFMYSFSLSIIYVLLRANGYLFHYRDYEILEPLPIKQKTVLYAKATVMLIFMYMTMFLLSIPIMFSYFYFAGFSLLGLLIYLIGFFFIPLIPMIIFSFISLLIASITSRLRRSKIFNILFMLVAFLVIMYFYMSFSLGGGANPFLNQEGFITGLGDIYLPMMWLTRAIHEHNVLNLLYFVLSSGVPFILFLIAIQKMVIKTNQKNQSSYAKNNKNYKTQTRTITQTILAKEFRKYISVPIYALNTGLGIIFLVILSGASFIYKADIQNYINQMGMVNFPIEVLLLAFYGFCFSTVYTSSISLSLEGNNFWILKSLPIKPSQIMYSKMIFNILLALPIALISLFAIGIAFEFAIQSVLVMALWVISFSALTSSIGSLINLYFPKFHYKNETEIVKQSVASVVSLFGGFALIVINGLLFTLFFKTASWQLSLLVCILVNGMIAGFAIYFVKRVAENLFIKMN